MEILLQIVNGTTISQLDSDTSLVYGTWALVVLTLAGIILTGILTKKSLTETRKQLQVTQNSNKLYEMELKTRLKPMLFFKDVSFNPKSPDKTTIVAHLYNYGTVPAKNLQYSYYIKQSELTLNELVTKEKEIRSKQVPAGNLLPDKTYVLINHILDHDMKKQIEFRVAYWFVYDFLDVKNYEEIHIIGYTNGGQIAFDISDKEQIDESRSRGGHSIGM